MGIENVFIQPGDDSPQPLFIFELSSLVRGHLVWLLLIQFELPNFSITETMGNPRPIDRLPISR